MFSEAAEQLAKVGGVLGIIGAADQDVVQIGKYTIQTGHHSVHMSLKGVAGVSEAKWHPQILK